MSFRRPTQRARWAWGAGATLVQPPAGSAEVGFATAQNPPAQWFNWQLNTLGGWVDFLAGPDVEKWTRSTWAATFNSPARVVFDVETATSDTGATSSAFRYAAVGENATPAARLHTSQRGNAWVERTNLPAGITGPFALKALAGRWLLGCLTSLGATVIYYTAADDGTGAGAIGANGNVWTLATMPGSPTNVTAFARLDAGNVCAACVTEAMYSVDGSTWLACTFSSAPSGDGRDVVVTSDKYVWVSQDGEVYTSGDGAAFTDTATLAPGSGVWQLTAGADREVLAWRSNQTSSEDLYFSEDSGTSWAAVTQPAGAPSRITSIAYREGVWIATSTRAPWLYVSNDLTSWRALAPPVDSSSLSPALYNIAWDGGAWAAIGNGFTLVCGRAADPADGVYVAEDAPSTLADAGSLRGYLVSTTAPSDNYVLTWDAGTSRWTPEAAAGGATSPLTTNGDLWTYTGGVDARLAVGSTAQVLTVAAGLPAWASLPWASHATASVQTTDATQTTCGGYTTTSNSAVTIKLLVTALKNDFTASCGWELTLTARNNGGTVTIEGGGAIIVGPTDTATTWAVTVDVSGADVRLRVTGAAATTIDWTARRIVG